ncbi:MAG: MraY family glycosyltransferase [Bacillota bacterium]|nr:MraY family glycosyltransferase [Bacillota bacterium]
MGYLYGFVIAFSISYLLIPRLKKLAFKIGFVDKPTERKKHKSPIPLLGGIGIFAGFFSGYFILGKSMNPNFFSILIASFLIFAIGLVDDWYKTRGKEFAVWPRILVQIISAVIVYHSGIVFRGFTNPFTHEYIVLPVWMQFILSITWLLGVTTVINWSDGMDGLAGGLSAISATTLFVVALAKGQPDSAMMSMLVVGAALGFLRYNKHPAEVYMGDSGANFLGFILGIIALDGAFKQTTMISVSIPILALGIPIFDNLFVIAKRFWEGTPIYKADSRQIHYRLLSSGLTQKQVVSFLYLMSVCLSLVSIILLLLKV